MPPDTLDDAFTSEASLIALPGGASLAVAGEPVVALHRLTVGRLAEVEPMSGGGGRLVAIHRPGALIGGAQLLGDGIHRTTVTALRDSDLECIPAGSIGVLLKANPLLLAQLARAALSPMATPAHGARHKSLTLGFIAVCDSVDARDLTERIAAAMRALGARVAVIGAEAVGRSSAEIHALEAAHDFLLMAAEHRETRFTAYCGRKIDRLILLGGAQTPLPDGPLRFATTALRNQRLIDFILVQPPGAVRPLHSDRWRDAAPASRLFQIRQDDPADIARLARVYTGASVGLALSGGGARAYAHVGVARALAELKVPIDFVAGTSMGAVIAAGVAMDWAGDEMSSRIRQAFVNSSPLSDIAFPLLAMTRGRTVDRRLAVHFEEVQISDLWRPFTCVSTDLTVGGMHIHRRGLLRRALRASLSLPGVLPPVVEDGHVLVDGALVRNLPSDLVAEQHEGVTIAVDAAAPSQGLRPEDLILKPSGLRWLTSGAWRKGPPIVAVLIRSATISSLAAQAVRRDGAILDVTPSMEGIGLQDWKAYDRAERAGYDAAMANAEKLSALKR